VDINNFGREVLLWLEQQQEAAKRLAKTSYVTQTFTRKSGLAAAKQVTPVVSPLEPKVVSAQARMAPLGAVDLGAALSLSNRDGSRFMEPFHYHLITFAISLLTYKQ
jgi:hypothetical protein